METFLDSAKLPKLSQGEIKHLNRLITNEVTEIVIKDFQLKNKF